MLDDTQSSSGGQPTLAEKTMYLSGVLLRWREHLEIALHKAGDSYTFDDVTQLVLTGEAQLFEFENCMLLMQIITFPQYKNYHCFIACGDMKELIFREDTIRKVAKELGCKELTISGRIGWPKVLKPHGWKERFVTLYTEV